MFCLDNLCCPVLTSNHKTTMATKNTSEMLGLRAGSTCCQFTAFWLRNKVWPPVVVKSFSTPKVLPEHPFLSSPLHHPQERSCVFISSFLTGEARTEMVRKKKKKGQAAETLFLQIDSMRQMWAEIRKEDLADQTMVDVRYKHSLEIKPVIITTLLQKDKHTVAHFTCTPH